MHMQCRRAERHEGILATLLYMKRRSQLANLHLEDDWDQTLWLLPRMSTFDTGAIHSEPEYQTCKFQMYIHGSAKIAHHTEGA